MVERTCYLSMFGVKWREVTQLCPTLCDSMDWGLPGSSIHEILQAGILEWVAISFSRGSSRPRNRTWVPCIVCRHFTAWATREVTNLCLIYSFFFFWKPSLSTKIVFVFLNWAGYLPFAHLDLYSTLLHLLLVLGCRPVWILSVGSLVS